jgi:prolyl oligopeptidase
MVYDPKVGRVRDTGVVETSGMPMADLEVTIVEVDAGEARIPMTILRRRGLPLDGRNPTKVIAYGSYGYSYLPKYLRQERAWLRRGGIIAFAHVRGGGEKGDSWHSAAVGRNKIVAVEDFIRCTEYLINQGYTSPEWLIASGASAGGIVVGAGVVQRPELFRAAVVNVPVVSILRFLERAPTGALFEFEFGSLENPEDYRALASLDAYYSIDVKRRYPPFLLMAGMNDPRVPVWQAAKMVAKLQATQGGRALLRVDFAGGHGALTIEQRSEAAADEDAFCWSVLEEPRGHGKRQPQTLD